MICLIMGTQFLSAQIFASIPQRDRGAQVDLSLLSTSYTSAGIDMSKIAQILPDSFTSDDVSKMIPTDMPASASGGQVASHIADQSMRSYFNSDSFKSTGLGKTSHRVEKSVQQDITVGGSDPDSIKHNFKLNMQAAQAKAMIDYTGYTNAQLTYKASAQELNLEIYRNISSRMKIAYNHINKPTDSRDVVSLNLGF